MWKRMLVMLLLVGLFIGALAFYKYRTITKAMEEGANFVMPPTTIPTMKAASVTWEPVLRAVGSLKAVNGVDVTGDLSGLVTEIAFESGATVKKGDLLVRLDTRQEQAQLASALAAAALAKVNVQRQAGLIARGATSQSDYDTAKANADQADAQVEEVRALIARKTVMAPFNGVLGLRQVNVGQYLDAGKAIVWLESQDPIYVEFSVPQQDIPKVAIDKKIRITATGIDGREFAGRITALNSRVTESNRNIAVEATVSNREGLLRGGMFVDVEVVLPEEKGVIVIPQSAVVYAPYGDSVFIVQEVEAKDGKPASKQAVQQFVKLGATRGDQVVVTSGVKEGDEVVSAGAFKLTSGASVIVNNSVEPENNPNPEPPET